MPKLVWLSNEAHCSEYPLEKKEFILSNKNEIFGRITLNILDQRISRNQVELFVENTDNGQILKVKQLGMNPSIILRSSGDKLSLVKDQTITMNNGEIIFLVGDCYPFRVIELEEKKSLINSKEEVENTNKRKANEEPKTEEKWLSPKKKKIDSVIQTETTLSNEKIETESQKQIAAESNSSSIQNENQVEIKSFESVSKSDDKKMDNFSESVKQLQDMFPEIPVVDIKQALDQCKGNLDGALDKLLNFIPQVSSNKQNMVVVDAKNVNNVETKKEDEIALRREEEQKKQKLAEQELQNQKLIIEMLTKEKEEIEKKSRELLVKRSELESARYMEGELDALKGTRVKKYSIVPERGVEKDAGQIHFRTAESQFHRLLETKSFHYQVDKVEYIVNPKLSTLFEKKRTELIARKNLEWEATKPVLCFHGIENRYIDNVVENGFSKILSDSGKGIYFSESPEYVWSYVKGYSKLLLCQVLLGKTSKFVKLRQSDKCSTGYDSHSTHDGKEIVLFSSDLILPCYIVHYSKKTKTLNRNYYGKDTTPTAPATTGIFSPMKKRSRYEAYHEEDEYEEEYSEDYDSENSGKKLLSFNTLEGYYS